MAHAQNPQDETVFMQCSVAGRDGQVTVSFKHEVAIYRFGPIGKPPELELFSPYTSLQKYYPSGHDIHEISEIVAFQNADYTYAVTMGFYDGWIEAGDWDEEDFGKIYRHTEGDEEFGSVVVHRDDVKLPIFLVGLNPFNGTATRSLIRCWQQAMNGAKSIAVRPFGTIMIPCSGPIPTLACRDQSRRSLAPIPMRCRSFSQLMQRMIYSRSKSPAMIATPQMLS